jgi:large subunit ribosomal protein L4
MTMANMKVMDLAGKEVGTLELDEIFAGEVNEALLWEAVKHYRASIRRDQEPQECVGRR